MSNLDLLQDIGVMLGALRGPWIICGDWQCPPSELQETGWLKTIKGVIHAPDAPTCGDRVLDYFVVSECLSQAWAIVAACVVGDQTVWAPQPGATDCQGQLQDDHGKATQGTGRLWCQLALWTTATGWLPARPLQ